MLNHPTLDKLHALKFTGMAKALTEQMQLPEIDQLAFEERLGLLVDREMTERDDRRLKSRLRKARLNLDGQDKVVRFKDARDFIRGINELVAARKIAFLELETWSDEFAFMLVRDPKWEKLAATDLVVIKAPQTAVGGECGECGAPVGQNWHDCLSCGAVFGSD